ncbi:MltA-interacting MipA [Salipiger sp. CCB-MM3]|uniref:MipA/OmpV family protein n=1 Tax=Salipiger sp. CCB-MM3 TaxID=1792508 RepID=UPI00080AB33A|nr:MipA/OmpV family protein [Salipiger sp. CCB-MM3]ANT60461.1 MltA-interacting MipA [Salipiger sp. CCB-MM3]
MSPLRHLAPMTLAAALFASPALAQDFGVTDSSGTAQAAPVTSTQSAGNVFTFTLRGGVSAAPKFLGSDEYEAGPDLGFSFKHLRLRGVPEIGGDDPWADSYGWDVHGSFRYLGKRDSSSDSALSSLDDIDPTYEVGLGVGYTAEQYEAFADIRRGFGGHEGYVGSVGIDYVVRPTDRWKLTLGPRFIWANDEFLDTYSGIDPDEATTDLPAYDPDGGLVSAGLQFGARYQINDLWGVEGAVTWDNLQGDAADSPIVDEGSNDQFRVRVGVTRVFNLRF